MHAETSAPALHWRLFSIVAMLLTMSVLGACVPLGAQDDFDLAGGLPSLAITPGPDGAVSAGELAAARAPTPSPALQGATNAPSAATPEPLLEVTVAARPTTSADYEPVQFVGRIETLPVDGAWNGAWTVAGQEVFVAPSTAIDRQAGDPAVGAQVEVQGWQRPGGGVNAGWLRVLSAASPAPLDVRPGGDSRETGLPSQGVTPAAPAGSRADDDRDDRDGDDDDRDDDGDDRSGNTGDDAERDDSRGARSRPVEFRGYVEQLPDGLIGDWRIGGRQVNVSAGTRIQVKGAALAEGDYVQVVGWLQADGAVNAAKIQPKKDNNGKGKGNSDPDRRDSKDEDR